MKALSLHQPWASFIALGAKTIETRAWGTNHRGPIAIHAAKTTAYLDEAVRLWARASPSRPRDQIIPREWPLGAVVAVATLVDCCQVLTHAKRLPDMVADGIMDTRGRRFNVPPADFVTGDLSPGRYAWILRDVVALPDPVPVRGRQGLWVLDADTERIIGEQWEWALARAAGDGR